MSISRAWPRAGVLILLVLLGTTCSRRSTPHQTKEWNDEIVRLESEHDSLRSRLDDLMANDPRIMALPQGDIVVGVPTAFLRDVIEHVFEDVASNVTLRLSGIHAHVAKTVKKVVTLGEFTVDVDSLTAVGKLRPGKPTIRFGGGGVSLSLPVTVIQGHGEAVIHFVWDSKNIADIACGDMDVRQRVSGTIVPDDYRLSGTMTFELRGPNAVGTYHFAETLLRIRVRPSQQSWNAIDTLLAQKHMGVCGWVLDKVDVPSLLTAVVETNGFNVKLPLDRLRPVRFPAGVQDSVFFGERALAVSAQTKTFRIDPDMIWYSAAVRVGSAGW
jgi:hypothetical protein